jgi:hypothetical protein
MGAAAMAVAKRMVRIMNNMTVLGEANPSVYIPIGVMVRTKYFTAWSRSRDGSETNFLIKRLKLPQCRRSAKNAMQ